MKYFKIFAMFILSIIMLIALFFSIGTFRPIKFLGAYYIPSIIMLIGFIFLMIYVAKTKNIYSLIASLFLSISVIIIISNLNISEPISLIWPFMDEGIKIITYTISAIISSIFLVGFMTLFFYFRSKSKKYIKTG